MGLSMRALVKGANPGLVLGCAGLQRQVPFAVTWEPHTQSPQQPPHGWGSLGQTVRASFYSFLYSEQVLGQYSSLHCLESLGSSYSHCSCLSTCTLNTVCLCWGHTYSPEAEHMQGTALGPSWMLTATPLLSYTVSSLCVHPQLKFQDSCGARLLFLILQHRLLASVHLVEHLLSWVASSASSIVSLWIQTSKSSSLLQHAQITQTHSKCLVLKKPLCGTSVKWWWTHHSASRWQSK